jgi:hypothetical protein
MTPQRNASGSAYIQSMGSIYGALQLKNSAKEIKKKKTIRRGAGFCRRAGQQIFPNLTCKAKEEKKLHHSTPQHTTVGSGTWF